MSSVKDHPPDDLQSRVEQALSLARELTNRLNVILDEDPDECDRDQT